MFQLLAAVETVQYLQMRDQRFRVGEVMLVVFQQPGDAHFERRFQQQAFAGVHCGDQPGGQGDAADLVALRFHVYRLRRIEFLQGLQQYAAEPFLRRLRLFRQSAQYRAAMLCQHFQIQHLMACVCQGSEQTALARSGCTADHAKVQALRQLFKFFQHIAAIGFVAAFQFVR